MPRTAPDSPRGDSPEPRSELDPPSPAAAEPRPHALSPWPRILFWSAASACILVALGAYGLFRTESRWAEIVREMRLSGDYFHPRINGVPYFDKPLLSYWLQALAARVIGRFDEVALRLPSALAALAALGATISLGRRVGSERQARAAGWILLTMIGFLLFARCGEADMLNLAAVPLAVAWYWKRRERPSFWSYLGFYAICFLGAQCKGLAALALPLLLVLPDLVKGSRWKAHLRLSHPAALVAAAGLYLGPLIYADLHSAGYRDSGLGEAFHENVLRYLQPFDHIEPFWVYFLYVPLLALPWLPLVPLAAVRAARSWRSDAWPARWLSLATALVFLFFTLSGSRRFYYVLPVLPFLALLIASLFEARETASSSRRAVRLQVGLLAALAVCGCLVPLARPWIRERLAWSPGWDLLGPVAALGALTLLGLWAARRWGPVLARTLAIAPLLVAPVVGSTLLLGGYMTWLRPLYGRFRTPEPLGRELGRLLEERQLPLVFCGKKFPADALFYTAPRELPTMVRETELAAFLERRESGLLLVAPDKHWDQVLDLLPPGAAREPVLEQGSPPWEPDESNHLRVWLVPPRPPTP